MADDRSRFQTPAKVATGIAGVLALMIPVGVWMTADRGADPGNTSSGKGATQTTATAPAGPTATGTGPVTSSTPEAPGPAATNANTRFLDAMQPESGGTALGALPSAFSGQPSYDHAVTIACPSNQTGDQEKQVKYVLDGKYLNLKTTVRTYKQKADDSKVQVQAFPDNKDPAQVQLGVNESGGLSADLSGAKKLTIRVTCEFPGAVVMLTGATLERT